jgi:glutamate synthase (NADPH) large chain
MNYSIPWHKKRLLSPSSCGVGFLCNINGEKSHEIVRLGIEAVKNLTHRGAVGADGKTGDGAGLLFQIPRNFFSGEVERQGSKISDIGALAVGVFFLHGDIEREIEHIFVKRRIRPLGWRTVPTNDEALGKAALSTKPVIKQILLDTADINPVQRELVLYITRRIIEKSFGDAVYISSLSANTIVYKGMLVATHLDRFYPDLSNEDFESAICLFHQRFSTNTFPDWTLAQPFRILAHNGEINTIWGNRNWIKSIEKDIYHELFADEDEMIKPVLSTEESDSASLDRIIELLYCAGFSLEHAMNLCIPPAWECCSFATDEHRRNVDAFFEYQSFLMKPWDGPAAIVFTDGGTIGAHLDRNGLRPLRYVLTEDGLLVAGSEIGMIDLEGRASMIKDRLGPGDTMSVNLINGEIKKTDQIINILSRQKPYREWRDAHLLRLSGPNKTLHEHSGDITRKQIAFGYTLEEINLTIKEMAEKAKEITFSMGDDTPLPSLSERPQLLFRYFRQRFSQVTNPPIDSIRERMVMSLRMNIGHKKNFLLETPDQARRLRLDSPILIESRVREIESQSFLKVKRISITFQRNPVSTLSLAIRTLQEKVIGAVRDGTEVIILSDLDISQERVAIPCLLATAAAFKALQNEGIANRASMIVETGEARDVHHMACLIGYNASAVHPYLAIQTIKYLCEKGSLKIPFDTAILHYKKALEDGLLRVIAKMGISTLNSYYGAHLFDSICLNKEFIEEFFPGTPVSIESDGINEIEKSLFKRHSLGFDAKEPLLENTGSLKFRKGGEVHVWAPLSVVALHSFTKSADEKNYYNFSKALNQTPVFLRHLFHFRTGVPLPLEEVESEEAILRRFFSGAMSVGALSPEAHEVIAEACNTLGIKSNSGEGGEDPARYWTEKNSAIKQIASGRFGVTPAYLASARELEIKIAQGAKPGEGGHLPAKKVTDYIAGLRHCSPGIILISPPPHHDIYSIEDLAQLINDLKEANPGARVCVKLVSETGVGTVAAGVAKAYADIIQISGCEGGTGAAYLSSIKNAGNYWETGLAETQQVLIENNLRERVTLRVDGGLRTGKDVVIAALLGAEEFGFGTATMIAIGCIMARQCHSDTCPTGIATQDAKLRKRFKGKAEDIVVYFRAIAREVRETLAVMGVRSIPEIIGKRELLMPVSANVHPATGRISLGVFNEEYTHNLSRRCMAERNNNPAHSMNDRLVDDLLPFINNGNPVEKEYAIRNVDRSIPVRLNYHIALRYKDRGLPPDTIRLTFRGTAGQSFGAFNHRGLSLTLIGDANDYVGKGMFGGQIIIRPANMKDPHNHVIVGNTVLYGATGGKFFAAGRAGERFAVRNSGSVAVIEGTGHHLCEYMTAGMVIVLGEVGYNVGAGMSGGVIFIYDERDILESRLNTSSVHAVRIEDESEISELRSVLEEHYKNTVSTKAYNILNACKNKIPYFRKVVPFSAYNE